MSNPLVLLNGNFITMDSNDSRDQALALEKGRIVRVGTDNDMTDLIQAGWPIMDLEGQTVLPGFIDTHAHLMATGQTLVGVPLTDVESMEDLLDRTAERARDTEKDSWVRGGGLNELELPERRMPNRDALDAVVSEHPVCLLHATLHMCSLNTKALELLKPPLDLPGLDQENGRPTGVVRDPGILTYIHPALARLIPQEEKATAIQAAAQSALRHGLTTVHALDGGDLGPGDTQVIHAFQNELPIHTVCYNQSMDLSEVITLNLPRVGGCICSDGAFEAHTAALFEPYADEPDNYGALTYSQETMDEFILNAHRSGLQISVHCESERSIEQVLWAMEKALRAFPRTDHRHRIEHFELPTPYQIDRLARAGIMASMQPAFIPAFIGQEDMAVYAVLLGQSRLRWVHPYATILAHGIPISGGSDSPVTEFNPLAGIKAAVLHPNREERVTLRQALEMFTVSAAYSSFDENDKGALVPGKLADLTLLAEDPYAVEPENISAIKTTGVFVAGLHTRLDN